MTTPHLTLKRRNLPLCSGVELGENIKKESPPSCVQGNGGKEAILNLNERTELRTITVVFGLDCCSNGLGFTHSSLVSVRWVRPNFRAVAHVLRTIYGSRCFGVLHSGTWWRFVNCDANKWSEANLESGSGLKWVGIGYDKEIMLKWFIKQLTFRRNITASEVISCN